MTVDHDAYLDDVAALVAAEIDRAAAADDVAIAHPAAIVRTVEARLQRPPGISLSDLAGHVRAAMSSLCSLRIAGFEAMAARAEPEQAEVERRQALVDLLTAHGFSDDVPLQDAMRTLFERGLIDRHGNVL